MAACAVALLVLVASERTALGGSGSAPASGDGGGPRRVSVVSYNVWGVPYIAPDRERRIAEIARRLADIAPDIVALQEVWVPEDAARIGSELARAGLTYQHHFGPSSEEKGSGLWIGSRYPLEDVHFERYGTGQKILIPWHVDWMAGKGVALARVLTPSGPLEVANTHLQAAYVVESYHFVRVAQALQLANALSRRAASGGPAAPLVLVGDLNSAPDSVPLRLLTARADLEFASSAFDIDGVYARTGSDVEPVVASVRTLFTDPVEIDGGTELLLSDHPCLLVEYELARCQRSGSCPGPGPQGWRRAAIEGLVALREEMAATERTMLASRAMGVAMPLAGLWLLRRARKQTRRRLGLGVLASVLAVSIGAWLGYFGWEFAPYKLGVLAAQAAMLEPSP